MTALSDISDIELAAALHVAIDEEPAERQPLLRQIAMMTASLDRRLAAAQSMALECNVVLARIVDRLDGFNREQARNAR